MLVSGDQVRLSGKECKVLEGLTHSSASHIKSKTQLKNFVQAHLVSYSGATPEERLLRSMLETFLPKD